MDTRVKIITFADASRLASGTRACWVHGRFDPLLAEHARGLHRLAQTGQLLIVSITDPERPLMPRGARAELVAALSIVDYVVMDGVPPQSESADDPGVRYAFIEHVIARHRAEMAQ